MTFKIQNRMDYMNDTKGYDVIMVNTYNNLTLVEAIDILMKNDCCRIEAYNKHHMSIRKKNCIQYRDALYE